MSFFLDAGEGLRPLDCYTGGLSLPLGGFPPGTFVVLRDGLDVLSAKKGRQGYNRSYISHIILTLLLWPATFIFSTSIRTVL